MPLAVVVDDRLEVRPVGARALRALSTWMLYCAAKDR
jgi:hypothetical protein